MIATEGLGRLPKWARQRIETLERDLAYVQGKLAEGPGESDTFADPYDDPPRPLGRETTVVFVLAEREDGTPRDYLHVRTDEDSRGERRVFIHGSDGLAFCPQASNTGYMKLVRS